MSWQRIGAVVLVIALLAGIFYLGSSDITFPGTNGADGSMSLVFYDAEGKPITNIAFISNGQVITGFSANWVISATGSIPLKTANLVGSYGYKIYGIDNFDKEHLLTTVEVNTFNVNDPTAPISWHSENYHSINILDPYTSYQDQNGWKVVVYVHGSVTAVNEDGETLTADVTATAYFCAWWQAGTITLTGEIGVG